MSSVPDTAVLVLYAALAIARFENQRWNRAISGGRAGTSVIAQAIAALSGLVALIFGLGFLAAWAFDYTLSGAAILLGVGFGASLLWVIPTARIGDALGLWILGTLAVWPLMIVLAGYVSWFGLN